MGCRGDGAGHSGGGRCWPPVAPRPFDGGASPPVYAAQSGPNAADSCAAGSGEPAVHLIGPHAHCPVVSHNNRYAASSPHKPGRRPKSPKPLSHVDGSMRALASGDPTQKSAWPPEGRGPEGRGPEGRDPVEEDREEAMGAMLRGVEPLPLPPPVTRVGSADTYATEERSCSNHGSFDRAIDQSVPFPPRAPLTRQGSHLNVPPHMLHLQQQPLRLPNRGCGPHYAIPSPLSPSISSALLSAEPLQRLSPSQRDGLRPAALQVHAPRANQPCLAHSFSPSGPRRRLHRPGCLACFTTSAFTFFVGPAADGTHADRPGDGHATSSCTTRQAGTHPPRFTPTFAPPAHLTCSPDLIAPFSRPTCFLLPDNMVSSLVPCGMSLTGTCREPASAPCT